MLLKFSAKGTKDIILRFLFLIFFISSFFTSCRLAYKSAIPHYKKIYQDTTAEPDYTNLNHWAAHPDKWDVSDTIPLSLKNEKRDTTADVFFIHPTTFLKNKKHPKKWNADIHDAELNAKTDYSTILYQASVFNGSCRVFAPRYRQAHIASFFSDDTLNARPALANAYEDIRKAFQHYLKYEHKGRPIIIAAHSQGTMHAARLLNEFFKGTTLSDYLVVAYLWGLPLPPKYFDGMQLCADSTQTQCIAGWRLYRKGYLPEKIRKENNTSLVINPITWSTDKAYIPHKFHRGAVLFDFNKVYKNIQGAQIKEGVVWIDKPKFPFSFLYTRKNYHAGDINLFYVDIRENIKTRLNHFTIYQKYQP